MKTVVTGLDIGNGYVKGRFMGNDGKPVNVDMPSCVSGIVTPPALADNVSDEYIRDIHNRMICQYHTAAVRDNRYFLLGNAALTSGRSPIEFDIVDNISKAEQDLSCMLVLGVIAGAALQNYWAEHGTLPDNTLNVNAQAALALPIDEYQKYRDMFANRFTTVEHEVTICNFEQLVHIMIYFNDVNVLPEGVSAQLAITSKGEAFMQALLDDVRSHDENILNGVTAADVAACANTCGIDIGEGTVNMPVIKDGRFNAIASRTLQVGYGTVLEQSLPRVSNENMEFSGRKALSDFLLKPVTAFTRNKHNTIIDIINSEAVDFVNQITNMVSQILRGGGVEVIYVYGGGATPLKAALYDELIRKTSSFAGGDAFPVLYLDSAYSRNLNREGLYGVAVKDYEYALSQGKIHE